jgi:hypothetical protein
MTANQPSPERRTGITMADLRTVDVSVELPGAVDPATGEPAIISFTCERLTAVAGLALEQMAETLKAREANRFEIMLENLAAVVTDTEGLADLERRGAGEEAGAYRERFRAYFREAGAGGELLVVAAAGFYFELQAPRPTFRGLSR